MITPIIWMFSVHILPEGTNQIGFEFQLRQNILVVYFIIKRDFGCLDAPKYL